MVYYNNPCHSELSLLTEWDHNNTMDDEVLSTTSHEEASKVLEQWQADQAEGDLDIMVHIMEVDKQIGSNLLGDDIFAERCASPCGPLDELVYSMNIDEDLKFCSPIAMDMAADDEFCVLSPSEDFKSTEESSILTSTNLLPFEEQYQESLRKLAESIQRSQATRKSLMMNTTTTDRYSRKTNVSGVIYSTEKSSYQLQKCLSTM